MKSKTLVAVIWHWSINHFCCIFAVCLHSQLCKHCTGSCWDLHMSVCPFHGGIVSKWPKTRYLSWSIPHDCCFCQLAFIQKIRKGCGYLLVVKPVVIKYLAALNTIKLWIEGPNQFKLPRPHVCIREAAFMRYLASVKLCPSCWMSKYVKFCCRIWILWKYVNAGYNKMCVTFDVVIYKYSIERKSEKMNENHG